MNFDINKLFVGIDLVEVDRFKDIEKQKKFIDNIFSKREINDCRGKNSFEESLAGRFAAKEAVKKTVEESIKFNEIEIINNKNGVPRVNFLNKKMSEKYKSIISISHLKSIAHAICITYKKTRKT